MVRGVASPRRILGALAGPLALGGMVLAAAAASIVWTRGEGRVAIVWPVNGLILAWLLLAPAARWPALLAAALAGNVAANLAFGDTATKALILALSNGVEITACALWLRRYANGAFDPSRPAQLGRFLVACLVGPVASTLIATTGLSIGARWAWQVAATWYASDALGLMIVTPLVLSFSGVNIGSLRRDLISWRGAAAMAALGTSLAAIMVEPVVPPYFLIPPTLVLAAFLLDAAGLALAISIVAAALAAGAGLGMGSHFAPGATLTAWLLHAQALLAVATLSALMVRAAVCERRRAEARLIGSIADLEDARAQITQSAALYRRVADNASDIIARTTIEGRTLYMSPSVTALTGYSKDQLGNNVPAFLPYVHPDDLNTISTYYRDLLASGRHTPVTPLTYRLRHRDGRWIWLESNPAILRDAENRPREIVDVIRDVTARTELEEALEASRRLAEEAATVKSRFIANMSHEIRSPLMAILGFSERLAKRTDLPADALRTIWKIAAAGRGLLAIANDVLDFSKLEAGSFTIRPHPCDVAQLCLDTQAIFEGGAQAKGLRLEVSIEGLPECLMLDGDRVRQVLTNFVGNAIKFTEVGGVTLRARHRDGLLRLELSDTGPGISPDDQKRLFQRFSQIDGEYARRHGGTGLGLAICKGLVEAMGGEVGIDSTKGRGSTFFADIPAKPPPAAAEKDQVGPPSEAMGS